MFGGTEARLKDDSVGPHKSNHTSLEAGKVTVPCGCFDVLGAQWDIGSSEVRNASMRFVLARESYKKIYSTGNAT